MGLNVQVLTSASKGIALTTKYLLSLIQLCYLSTVDSHLLERWKTNSPAGAVDAFLEGEKIGACVKI